MKTIYSLALLCLVGCASKPKPILEYGINSCGQHWIAANCPHGWFVDASHSAWVIAGREGADEHDIQLGISSLTCHRETKEEILSIAKTLAICPSHHVVQALAWLPMSEGSISHVTPEQWRAAQGLYMWDIETSGKGFEVVDWNYLVTKVFKCRYEGRPVDCRGVMHASQGQIIVDDGAVSSLVTFPPSGDDK